jgi:hypothetical protein
MTFAANAQSRLDDPELAAKVNAGLPAKLREPVGDEVNPLPDDLQRTHRPIRFWTP